MSTIVFDEHFEGYDDWYQTRVGAFVDRVETQAAFRLLAPQAGLLVLDAGCGTGNFSLKLAHKGCDVTGIDISENMLAIAAQKAAGESRVRFLKMDAAHLDFNNNSFDAVLSMAAIEFIPHPGEVYKELKRVVRPGGAIVIGTIQKGGDWATLYSSPACAGTAYANAAFKTRNDIADLDRESFAGFEECLFVQPGLGEDAYSDEAEAAAKAKKLTGGFICVKFVKKM